MVDLWQSSGLAQLFNFENGGWKCLIMIAIACVLLYLAIKKQFEPLLLLPIAFGMLLVNLPLGGVMDPQRNSLVPLTPEETQSIVDGTYAQVYPVYEMEYELDVNAYGAIEKYTNANGVEMEIVRTTDGGMYKVVTDEKALKVTLYLSGSTLNRAV